ncbi:limkain-b1-type NYN domain-containing protein, partial [Phellopilus nigrolimitatus]
MSSPSQVAVFWDYENCRPPSNVSGFSVVDRIRRIVEDFGNTTVFKAYVDLSLECANARSIFHSELQSSGLSIIHCPHNGRKDVADKMMLVDMLAFAIDSPAPATIVLITGDRDFAYAVAILRFRGYEVIIIAPSSIAHLSLKSQACRLYDW